MKIGPAGALRPPGRQPSRVPPVKYVLRNAARAAGVEVVLMRPSSSLLAMHLSLLFRRYGIDTVLDVGARTGEFGLWLRRNGYKGAIISFEPVPENFDQLARVSGPDPSWHCVDYALGAEDSSASINVTKLTHFSSFHRPNDAAGALFGSDPSVQRTEVVEVRRLDTVIGDLPFRARDSRSYLKSDTQGWDLEVLAGAAETLQGVVALQTEVAVQPIYDGMPLIEESLDTIRGLGFTPSGLFPVCLGPDLDLVELDLVAVRAQWNAP